MEHHTRPTDYLVSVVTVATFVGILAGVLLASS
jgi:hypothetical protein